MYPLEDQIIKTRRVAHIPAAIVFLILLCIPSHLVFNNGEPFDTFYIFAVLGLPMGWLTFNGFFTDRYSIKMDPTGITYGGFLKRKQINLDKISGFILVKGRKGRKYVAIVLYPTKRDPDIIIRDTRCTNDQMIMNYHGQPVEELIKALRTWYNSATNHNTNKYRTKPKNALPYDTSNSRR